ncbi:MAG: GntP family permease, partial [Verrucomicrobiales bacterium]
MILLITKLGMHPFFALLVTGMVVGMLSASLPGEGSHWIKAIETPLAEMGKLAGKIAFVIALAAVIGICLTESGVALLLSGFVLSDPVFFDTVFFLLIPLARALARQVGKNYVLFVMAMAGGAVITHSLVPPTPGPLLMTEAYGILLGSGILGGVLMGLPPAFFALWLAKKIDARMPLSPVGSESDATSFSEEGLPSFGLSILPVLLPVLLVTSVSIVDTLGQDKSKAWYQALSFFGNKNMALLIGTLLAVSLVVRKLGRDREALQGFVNDALQTAGVIILIT